MTEFRKEISVNATPDRAWEVLGDLSSVTRWIPGIVDVRVQGNERVCTFANGAVQHETISDYSGSARSYRYEITGSPLPVKNNRGRFSVEARGSDPGGPASSSTIVWEHEFELLDAAQEKQIVQMWEGAAEQIAGLLRKLVEEQQ
ncbi:SRPBCC family protein [Nitrososphaera sp.]|uniref:SRPBCC family protein n=1 Tax=Nitrososphaera sp. TaxID=1971748 RepID=UPI00307DDF8D